MVVLNRAKKCGHSAYPLLKVSIDNGGKDGEALYTMYGGALVLSRRVEYESLIERVAISKEIST